MIENRRIRLAEVIVMAIAVTGLVLQFSSTAQGGILRLFNYYTIQTNLMAAGLMLSRCFNRRTSAGLLDAWTGAITIWIFIAGLGYHTLLAALYKPVGLAAVANAFVHTITPLSLLVFFLLFAQPGRKNTLIWLTYPVIYIFVSLLRGAIDGFYPYWFLTPKGQYPKGVGSYGSVLLLSVVLAGLYVLIGQLFWFLRGLLRRTRKLQ